MNVERKRNYIHTLIHKYAAIGKDYTFIKRVIPEMNDNQYKNVLTRIYKEKEMAHSRHVCLGSKQEPYYKSEEEMLSVMDFSGGKYKGWERDQILFKENVTLFPLFTYEE